MVDENKKLSEFPEVNPLQLNPSLLIPVVAYDPQLGVNVNRNLPLGLLSDFLSGDQEPVNPPDVNHFLGQERLNQINNIVLTTSSPKFQYIEASTDLDCQLPTPVGSDYFRFRSLNGSNTITIKDHQGNDLIFLGDEVNNNNSGVQTRLLGDCHYIQTQWICNVF